AQVQISEPSDQDHVAQQRTGRLGREAHPPHAQPVSVRGVEAMRAIELSHCLDESPSPHDDHIGAGRLERQPVAKTARQPAPLEQAAAQLDDPHASGHLEPSRARTAKAWAGAHIESSGPSSLVSEMTFARISIASSKRSVKNSPRPEMTTVSGGCLSRATSC